MRADADTMRELEIEGAVCETGLSRPLYRPHDRPTRRGWLSLGSNGGPCDKACKFCYYAYQRDLIFFTLDTLLMTANRFRYAYGYDACDISGGEPTIYPHLLKVVEHCAAIGLHPSIITHGQNNTRARVEALEAVGLDDWLVSLHGVRASHERAVVDRRGHGEGGWDRTIEGLSYMRRPVRFNTTIQKFNYQTLPELARWLVDHQTPTVWNMIQFNPFHAWGAKDVIDFQVPISRLAPFVGEALRIAEAAGWEVNVRYFAFCVAGEHGFAQNCVNYYQTQYDPWEWGLEATHRLGAGEIHARGGQEATRRSLCDDIRDARSNAVCASCDLHTVCEGPTLQYQKRFGLDELRPLRGGAHNTQAYPIFAKKVRSCVVMSSDEVPA